MPRRDAPSPGAWIRKAVATLCIGLGVWTLPIAYFIGFNTTAYPVPVQLGLGGLGIAAGIGLLRRRHWGEWLAYAFLLSQLLSVRTTGFKYDAVINLGFWLRFNVGDRPVEMALNVPVLLALIGLLLPRFRPAPEPPPARRR